MAKTITGRYGLAHGDIIAQLLTRTDMTDAVLGMYVMAHVRELERERDAALAERDAFEHQLNHIITGE